MDIGRRRTLQTIVGATAASMLGVGYSRQVFGQSVSREETLRHVAGVVANGLDPNGIGGIRDNRSCSMSFYDRLVAFGKKPIPGGGYIDDPSSVRGELAERYEVSADGTTYTFHINPNATWHDGKPVTAKDVKWSLDRGVSAKTLAASFFRQASLTSTDQFVITGDHQVEIRLPKADRLVLPMLCTPFASMYNSELTKKQAGADDEWAVEWLKENVAGSGAYAVERYVPGQQLTMLRNEKWLGGENGGLPYFRRVIVQAVPESATRANLLERGDADIAIDLSATDVQAIQQRDLAQVLSVPQFNVFEIIAFGTKVAPFDNLKVRQAVAAALPYGDMLQAAHYGRGKKLTGGNSADSVERFGEPWPTQYDIDRAKQLLAEAGHADGFSTSIAFSTSAAAYAEPMAALIKEALAKVGIQVSVQKLPDAQFTTSIAQRKLPMACINFAAYFVAVEYMARTFFTGGSQHNYSGWENPEIAPLARAAQYELSEAKYTELCQRMVNLIIDEMPVVMLWQPNKDAVTAKGVSGFKVAFHSLVDYRDLVRA